MRPAVEDLTLAPDAPTDSTHSASHSISTVLIVTTARLASTAHLAMEFADAGARVVLLAPPGHFGFALDMLADRVVHHATRPLRTLRSAIRAAQPHLVVPCDELS